MALVRGGLPGKVEWVALLAPYWAQPSALGHPFLCSDLPPCPSWKVFPTQGTAAGRRGGLGQERVAGGAGRWVSG